MPDLSKFNRRDFLKNTAKGGVAGLGAFAWMASSDGCEGQSAPSPQFSGFETLVPHVKVYRDVINVGLIHTDGKAVLIDSGDGAVLTAAQAQGITSVEWVLFTHCHRDQCSGAALLQRKGAKLAVPATEADLFRDATEFWLTANKRLYHRYDYRPDFLVLRDSVVPDKELRAGDVFMWEGISIHVVGTPGHTAGSLSYIVELDGEKIVFAGDLIYGPGQVWNFYSFQKPFPGMNGSWKSGHGGYWGFGGAVPEVKKSLDELSALRPTVMVPSHGVVMHNPIEAAGLLKENLDAAMRNYLTLTSWRVFDKAKIETSYNHVPLLPSRPVPTLPSWLHKAVETSWYIQAEDGTIFLFDCGFEPIMYKINELHNSGAISGVDGIWISHYHDDHVTSVNEMRRVYGAEVYAQKELQDILEHPRAYLMPCLLPESIHVDHPLQEGKVIHWKGYEMTGYYFPGQTLFHDGLLIEHKGGRIFMCGDALNNFGIDDYCIYNRNFLGDHEPGYQQCFRTLLKLKPDMLVAAHFGPLPFAPKDIEKAQQLLRERYSLFQKLLPWEDPNFGMDPHWVRAYPFHQAVFAGSPVTLEVRIYNHGGVARRAWAELRVPEGWKSCRVASVVIPAHSEGRIQLRAVSSPRPARRRDVLGIVLRFGERNLGEVEEAVIDYLS